MIRSKLRRYDDEFKREAVNLVNKSTKSIAEIAENLGIPKGTLYSWVNNGTTEPTGKVVTNSELTQLKKELAATKLERDILKKAVAIFSQK